MEKPSTASRTNNLSSSRSSKQTVIKRAHATKPYLVSHSQSKAYASPPSQSPLIAPHHSADDNNTFMVNNFDILDQQILD